MIDLLHAAAARPADFDDLYAQHDDPWQIENRWYERRKRALILAALPFETTGVIVEPGCGTGIFSALLAKRCTRLVACDISAAAVAMARHRLANAENIDLSCQQIPRQWPSHDPHSVDCIILSELGYYLASAEMPLLIERIAGSLKRSGILVACHWQGAFPERTLSTSDIHEALASGLGLQTVVHHVERDFLLDVWSGEGHSVAMQEGFA